MALALCLAWLFLNCSTSKAQTVDPTTGVVSSTGNLISPTGWNGITYTNNAGVSQCCWGGPAPAMNQDTNTIRFSWGYSTASQIIGINTALANAGSGIKLNGYNYSWIIDNEGATQGTLTGNVSLQGANGQTLESYSYNYNNTNINLQTFSGTQNFTTSYGLSSVSSLDVSFTGKDNRFWAGYYGPRVRDVNVSLNYTSAPSSPSPGTPTTTPTVPTTTNSSSNNVTVSQTGQATVATSSTTVTPPIGQTSSNPTMTSVTTVNVGGADVSSTGTVTAQDNVPQAVKDSQASATTSAPATTTQSSTTVITATTPSNTQPGQTSPKIGPSATASQALKQAQAREQATQKAAVQNAQAVVSASTAQSQETATTAIASINAMAVSNSQPTQSSAASSVVVGNTPVTQTVVTSTNTQQAQVQIQQPTVNNTSSNKSNSNSSGFFGLTPMSSGGSGLGLTASIQQTQPVTIQQYTPIVTAKTDRSLDVEVQSTPLGFGGLGRPGNPLNDVIMGRVELQSSTEEQRTETVNRNVQPNELSVGVTLEAMAVQPQGFETYSVALKDAAFYEPKEIYRNQTTVDNVRALRQMASDRVYQQMLDMQYKIGE